MEKRSVFHHRFLPYALLLPQITITLVFFYWPASQAVWQSFLIQDAFGLATTFVWFENYVHLFSEPDYYNTIANTLLFSTAVTVISLSAALLLAVMADKPLRGAGTYRTLLIWPYAVAPAVAGVLWAAGSAGLAFSYAAAWMAAAAVLTVTLRPGSPGIAPEG